MKFEHKALTGETCYVQLEFFKILLFVLEIKLSFQFVSFVIFYTQKRL